MDWLKLPENCPQSCLTQMWTLPLTIIVYVPSRPPEGCSLKIPANILMVKGLWEASSKPGCLWHEYQLADCPSQREIQEHSHSLRSGSRQRGRTPEVEHSHPRRRTDSVAPDLYHLCQLLRGRDSPLPIPQGVSLRDCLTGRFYRGLWSNGPLAGQQKPSQSIL